MVTWPGTASTEIHSPAGICSVLLAGSAAALHQGRHLQCLLEMPNEALSSAGMPSALAQDAHYPSIAAAIPPACVVPGLPPNKDLHVKVKPQNISHLDIKMELSPGSSIVIKAEFHTKSGAADF